MRRVKSAFALEVFDRRNAKSERLARFLNIYVQNLGPEHRTNSNELMEFLANPPNDRSIIYFGLTYDDEPCGFATFMHYPSGPIAMVDHFVIMPNTRGFGAFFNFCDLIAQYLEDRRIIFDHVVAEVMLSEKQFSSTVKPQNMLRLMRFIGFRIAKIAYWAPDPSMMIDMDSCKAALLFASRPERDELPMQEFTRLIRIIYNTHYANWYERTMQPAEFASYKETIDGALAKILRALGNDKRIKLNGMKNLDLKFVIDPNPPVEISSIANIALIVIPAVVGVSVGFAQEKWVTGLSILMISFLFILLIFHPRLRLALFKFFRLIE